MIEEVENENSEESKSWLLRLAQTFSGEPQTKNELLQLLKHAESRALIDKDELDMIEGAIKVSTKKARDIMIPRSQMACITENQNIKDFLPVIVNTRHSRFPVLASDNEEVIGVLHAKDLLKFYLMDKPFTLDATMLHEAIIVPESKRLDNLLREFQNSHNHMAIVVDEYGSVSGAITIEDILEEIVGEIEDEFDDAENNFIQKLDETTYLIKAITPVETFNEFFSSQFSDDKVDTMGGVITQFLGHLPIKNEQIQLENFEIEIKNATKRVVKSFTVKTDEKIKS